MIGKAIFSRLSDPAQQAGPLVARDEDDGGAKVFPHDDIDESASPFVTYEVTDEEDVYPIADSNLTRADVQIDAVAEDADDAADLARAIMTDLNEQQGTWGGVVVTGCFAAGVGSNAEPVLVGDRTMYTRTLAATFWYRPH